MDEDYGPEAWLAEFSKAYGRMCLLAAQAMARHSISRERVAAALEGTDKDDHHIRVGDIRRQRRKVVVLLKQAKVCGVTQAAIIQTGKEARAAIGQEWGVDIPTPNET